MLTSSVGMGGSTGAPQVRFELDEGLLGLAGSGWGDVVHPSAGEVSNVFPSA